MSDQLLQLPETTLRDISSALRSGRVTIPISALSVQRISLGPLADAIARDLQGLADQGLSAEQIALVLDLLQQDRSRRAQAEPIIDLVISGPESSAVANRDTTVVVRDLFATAEHSVLIAGYAVYQGQQVFQALAARMQQRPDLAVRLYLDVRRPDGDTSEERDVVRRFGERFRRFDWPNICPVPEVFYFPASLSMQPQTRASLHAKCIVVDRALVFVSSANFTEAAQRRNIEVGLLLKAPWLGDRLTVHFESLVSDRALLPVFPK